MHRHELDRRELAEATRRLRAQRCGTDAGPFTDPDGFGWEAGSL
jgi:hypothetical protein